MNSVSNVERGTVLAEQLESANSLWAKFCGLMGRATLADGAGLWLPGSNGIHMMFMRFAIDAVFVGKPEADGSREVLSVHRALPPWRGRGLAGPRRQRHARAAGRHDRPQPDRSWGLPALQLGATFHGRGPWPPARL